MMKKIMNMKKSILKIVFGIIKTIPKESFDMEIRQEFIEQAKHLARNAEVLPGGIEELAVSGRA